VPEPRTARLPAPITDKIIELKQENPRGRAVRIVERNGNRADSVIIPATGLQDFQQLLAAMVKAEKEIPPKT